MEKCIEVELRALVDDPRAFQEALIQKGAEYQYSAYIKDVYFCEKRVTSLTEVEMHAVGSYGLRVRLSRKGDAEVASINAKTITNEGDHHAWEEHEVVVDNFTEAARMLSATAFKPFLTSATLSTPPTYPQGCAWF